MSAKPALAALVSVSLLAWGSPAFAEDNDGLEDPNSCAGILGGSDVPPGTVILVSTGFPVPPGVPPTTDGTTSIWYCDGGHWVYGGTLFEVPPITLDATSVEVPEGTTATMTGAYSGADAGLVTFSSSIGTASADTDSTWSWSATPDDGPATQQVTVTSTADGTQVTAAFELDVTNVAPTAIALTPSATVALVGQPVTFTGAATDPSNADTAAGFTWDVSDGSTQSFDACGQFTVTGTATDKDGGASEPITSGPVNVVEAAFGAPIVSGSRNVVQAGRVVPIRVTVGCGTSAVSGLSPTITLLSGDVDPDTSSDDPATVVPVVSASAADASGVMREADGSYLYNLKVPQAATGSRFTIRVRPLGGAAIQAVLEVR